MNNNSPIGVFDSGVGGLSVLKELIKELPQEKILYFGDTLRVPYGDKTLNELVDCTRRILDFFKERDVKCVIVACNTCSANTIEIVKDEYDFEILGLIEPAAKYISSFNIKNVGLIATKATVNSNAYKNAIEPCGIKVFQQSCPKLVRFVERGETSGENLTKVLREYLNPLINEKVEKLILGCTHYPFLVPAMMDMGFSKDFFINPAICLSIRTKEYLQQNNLLSNNKEDSCEFYVSGNEEEFKHNAELFFGNIKNVSKALE